MQASPEWQERPEGGGIATAAEGASLSLRGRFRRWLKSSTPDMKVGTLQYTGASMVVVFLWLFWGDIIFTLSEAVFPNSIAFQLDRLEVPKVWIGILKGTAAASVSAIFVPMIGFRSDRTRTRFGRRIPYIFWTLIPVTISLACLGFTDDIGAWIRASDWPARAGISSSTAILVVVGAMVIIFDISNVFITTVWWFLLRDVVPNHYIIRFMAAFGLVSTVMNIMFNSLFAWRVETHTRQLYLGAAALYLLGFLIICYKVKEGQYPPPDKVKGDSVLSRFVSAAKMYVTQCFTHPLILMMYMWAAVTAFQAGASAYQILYNTRHLGITLKQQAVYWSWQGVAILIIKYPIGASLHRWVHPMKGLFWAMLLLQPLPWLYFMVGDYQIGTFALSAYGMWMLINMWQCPLTQMHYLSLYPLQVRLFPHEQFGQFRSAEIMVTSFISIFSGAIGSAIVGEWMFHKFGTYGYGITFLWQGIFSLIGFVCLCLMFYYWKLYGGANFQLDLKARGGPTSRELWRPIKVGAGVVALIVTVAALGAVAVSRRPDFGFYVDRGKELSTAHTLVQLMERSGEERRGFDTRHERNLRTLGEKRWFWEADTVREQRNYRRALVELQRIGMQSEMRLHWMDVLRTGSAWPADDAAASEPASGPSLAEQRRAPASQPQ